MSVFWDPRCDVHTVPRGFPERPERLQLALPYLSERDWDLVVAGSEGPPGGMAGQARRLAALVHDPEYIERMESAVAAVAASAAEGEFPLRPTALLDTNDNPLSPGTADAAWGAVGAALAAGDHAMLGAGHRAMTVTRPPGHHCERDRAMGFCYLNQVAILAQGLIDVYGVERVAILDFDVHHGNGTQHLFDHRADIAYLSVHQYPFYPGTGAANERGIDAGEGTTINAPLPAGSGDDVYGEAMRDLLLPAVRSFRPNVRLSRPASMPGGTMPIAGMDPLTEYGVDGEELPPTFGVDLADLAEEVCEGRLVSDPHPGHPAERGSETHSSSRPRAWSGSTRGSSTVKWRLPAPAGTAATGR